MCVCDINSLESCVPKYLAEKPKNKLISLPLRPENGMI